jgi:putative hemolysin
MLGELVIILLLVLANGLFSAAEIAILSVRKTRLHELASQGSGAAALVQRLRKNPEQFLATLQIGVSVIGATAAAFGGASFARQLASTLRALGVERFADDLALAAAIGLVSYFSLVLGELVPKSLALRHAERYALIIARPVQLLGTLARPLVWFLTKSSNAVLRFFRDETRFVETRLSEEELRQLLEEATEAGELDVDAGDVATRAIDLGKLTVGSILVARPQIVAVEKDTALRELVSAFLTSRHARLPVYDREPDRVFGYVSVWRALDAVVSNTCPTGANGARPGAHRTAAVTAGDLAAPVEFVAKTTRALDVLRELQLRRARVAIVLEESGGVAGLVTIEDLLSELVGIVPSEHPPGEEEFKVESGDCAVVSGTVHVRDVNRTMELELPEEPDAVTMGGLATKLAYGIPRTGAVLPAEHATLEVLEASPQRVLRLRVRRAPRRA